MTAGMASGIDLSPRPGAAPAWRMVLRSAAFEYRMLIRNGEQVFLTLVIPVVLLLVLARSSLLSPEGSQTRIDLALPSVLAVAIVATSFTSLAIATGFERRYQALRRMAMTPLPRWGLLAGKAGAVLAVVAMQVVLLLAVGVALGWRPQGSVLAIAVLILLGVAAFAALGLLLAGTVRAEATLAAANVVFLLLLVFGGLTVPVDQYPEVAQGLVAVLPSAALGEGLRAAFEGSVLVADIVVLSAWAAAAAALATRYFRWD